MSPILSTFSLGSGNRGSINPVTSFSLVAANSTTTQTFTISASAQAGDFAVYAHTNAANNGDVTTTDSFLPSGWTRIYRNVYTSAGNEDSVYDVAWKKLESGDPSSSITVASSDGSNRYGFILVYRPDNPFNTVTVEVNNHQVGDVNPAVQGLLGTSYPTPHFMFATYGALLDSSLGSETWTSTAPNNPGYGNVNSSFAIYYKMYNVGDTLQSVQVDLGNEGFDHTRLASHAVSFT